MDLQAFLDWLLEFAKATGLGAILGAIVGSMLGAIGTYVVQRKQFAHEKERWELQRDHEIENRSFEIRLKAYRELSTVISDYYVAKMTMPNVDKEIVKRYMETAHVVRLVGAQSVIEQGKKMTQLITDISIEEENKNQRERVKDHFHEVRKDLEDAMRADLGIPSQAKI